MPRVRHVPQRQCVACRQMRPKREMVRVVRTPAGDVRVDLTGKASGRGAYVCPSEGCAAAAVRDRRLEHALAVPIPEVLADELQAAIRRFTQLAGKV
ncbi:MAG: RNase P modulator RnpM [Armatimonadota bacterium]